MVDEAQILTNWRNVTTPKGIEDEPDGGGRGWDDRDHICILFSALCIPARRAKSI